jgi:hypothetical protein
MTRLRALGLVLDAMAKCFDTYQNGMQTWVGRG